LNQVFRMQIAIVEEKRGQFLGATLVMISMVLASYVVNSMWTWPLGILTITF